MDRVLNLRMIAHPMNWVTVLLMTIIGLIALNLILTPWHIPTQTSDQLNANSIPGPYLATMQ